MVVGRSESGSRWTPACLRTSTCYVWSADGLTVAWELVEGQLQKAQHGSYVLKPLGSAAAVTSTKVTYSVEVDLTIPLIAMVKRRAEKVTMDTALKGLKHRVELLAHPMLASLTAALHRRIPPLTGRAASRSRASQFRR